MVHKSARCSSFNGGGAEADPGGPPAQPAAQHLAGLGGPGMTKRSRRCSTVTPGVVDLRRHLQRCGTARLRPAEAGQPGTSTLSVRCPPAEDIASDQYGRESPGIRVLSKLRTKHLGFRWTAHPPFLPCARLRLCDSRTFHRYACCACYAATQPICLCLRAPFRLWTIADKQVLRALTTSTYRYRCITRQ